MSAAQIPTDKKQEKQKSETTAYPRARAINPEQISQPCFDLTN